MICPECGAEVPVDAGFAPWCDRCDWMVDPGAPPGPRSRLLRWRLRRTGQAVRAARDRAVAGGTPDRRGLTLVALLAALPVHLLTLALAVGVGLLAVGPGPGPARAIGAAVLVGVLSQVVPWPARVPAGPGTLRRPHAPASFRVLDQVAGTLGTRAPDLVVASSEYTASYQVAGWRRRRVLTLGLPLWNVLDGDEQVAVLGHELGHDVNGDVRRLLPVALAAQSLDRWVRLLHPGYLGRHDGGGHARSLTVRTAELVASLILRLVALLTSAIGCGVARLALRAGQPAEYAADRAAVRVAGRDATAALLTHLMLQDQAQFALLSARNRDSRDPWADQRARLGRLPEREMARAERRSRLRGAGVDDSHPPTAYRLDVVRALPASPRQVAVSDADLAAMRQELFAALPDG